MCSRGPDVRTLQLLLNMAVPTGALKVDGAFGVNTDRVVREYQKRNGLKVDGVVGPATAKALGLLYSGGTAVRVVRAAPGKPPRPPEESPFQTIAGVMTEELEALRCAFAKDIQESGAAEKQINTAIDTMKTVCFQYAGDGLKDWAKETLNLTTAETAALDLAMTLTDLAVCVAKVGMYVKEKGHGVTKRLAYRLDSFDVDAIQRIVVRLLSGDKYENLQAAVWDIHQVMMRCTRDVPSAQAKQG